MNSSTRKRIYNSSDKRVSFGPPTPPSALRKGKFDNPGKLNQIRRPILDLSIIYDTFGESANLYNVLGVNYDAEADDIRRAYLGQGRAALLKLNDGFTGTADDAPLSLDDVPEKRRKMFQAISIAYEILSNPRYRCDYDRYGVVYALSSTSTSNADETRPLRRSVSWKPYFEEKVIDDFSPEEHSHRTRPEVTLTEEDNSWLESNLRNIDEETDQFLRGDLVDSFDESLMSLQDSLESLVENVGNIMVRQNKSEDAPAPIEISSQMKSFVEHLHAKGLESLKHSFGSLLQNIGSSTTHAAYDATVVEPNEGISIAIESRKNLVQAKGKIYCKESPIGDELHQPHQKHGLGMSLPAMHSPCSVICVDDMAGTVGCSLATCGLSDSFYDLLGQDDDIAEYIMDKSDLVM